MSDFLPVLLSESDNCASVLSVLPRTLSADPRQTITVIQSKINVKHRQSVTVANLKIRYWHFLPQMISPSTYLSTLPDLWITLYNTILCSTNDSIWTQIIHVTVQTSHSKFNSDPLYTPPPPPQILRSLCTLNINNSLFFQSIDCRNNTNCKPNSTSVYSLKSIQYTYS
jgi:hypothetical protein